MAEAYDASEVDERPRSTHLSRKDVRVMMIVVGVLILLMIPIYSVFKAGRDKYLCKTNLGQMFKAMGIYLEQNNERYPPAFVVGENGEPNLFDGSPYTWMSLIHDGMGERYSFACPAAGEKEGISNLNPSAEKAPFRSHYGLYMPWSTYNSTLIVNESTSILVAETANGGAEETFNPNPFSNGVDGMVIGWNDGNFEPTRETEYVTRLAFPRSKGGKFVKEGAGRHGKGIHVLFASGQLGFMNPTSAEVHRLGSEITGNWAVR
jgi:hypothetical protein